jgi:hypothetical protein
MDAAVVPSTSEVATIRNASKRILFIGTRGAGILDVVRGKSAEQHEIANSC